MEILALDGALLSLLRRELEQNAVDARIDRIFQPSKEELVFALRSRAGSFKLLLSCHASSARIHFTQHSVENPATPPMLCMVLRKHLTGARLAGFRQPGLERALFLDFSATNMLGDPVHLTLAVEIMGRHSNIILTDEAGTVIDAVKRVDPTMSSVRPILPGIVYSLPPAPANRLDITQEPPQAVLKALEEAKETVLSKALLAVLLGLSPVVCREIAHYTGRGEDPMSHSLTPGQSERLLFYIGKLQDMLLHGESKPVMLTDVSAHKPFDFSFTEISQYGLAATTAQFDSFSNLLDAFYAQRDRIDRVNQRAKDLLRLLSTASDRIARKINTQQAELRACADRDRLRIYGDLLNANLYQLQKGMPAVTLENFYEEGNPLIHIPLDPAKTPSQNAQKYYKDYRRAQTAERILAEQIVAGEQELRYIDTVFDALSRADTERELSEIRQELASQGYGKNRRSKQKPPPPLGPLSFLSGDGLSILAGRNNRQNDQLTLKDAHGSDLWLHVKNGPGCHVIVRADGNTVPASTVEDAAMVAAYYSHAKDSAQVAVDYTLAKNVKKPAGAKPGMVIYTDFRTVFVTPASDRIAAMNHKE